MSKIAIEGNASGTGTFTIASPNSNASRTLSLPDGTGTFVVNGINSSIVSGTSVASTSGTSIDFTGIPSWVRRITVMFNGVSTNGTSFNQIQIGSGSFTTSGYASQFWTASTTSGLITTGFGIFSLLGAGNSFSGSVVLTNITGNIWVCNGNLIYANVGSTGWSSAGNSPALGGTLDRVRITTVNGTDTFDAGTINILYE
jgi:hypothetical protein